MSRRRTDQIPADVIPKGSGEPLGHLRGLDVAVEKPGDGADRDLWPDPLGEVLGGPAFEGDVFCHQARVEVDLLQHNETLRRSCYSVNTFLLRRVAVRRAGGTMPPMAKPARVMPVYYPALGAYLLAQREQRQWSVARLIAHATRAGHPLTPQQVRGVEMGTTRFIDPDIFRAIGAAYRIPYAALVARFVLEAYGPEADLVGHTDVGQRGSQGGPSYVVAAQARLQQLEQENRDLRAALDAISAAVAASEPRRESATSTAHTTPPRRHRRADGR